MIKRLTLGLVLTIAGTADAGRPSRPWDAAIWQVGGSNTVARIIADTDPGPTAPTWWKSLTPAPLALYDPTAGTNLASSLSNLANPGTFTLTYSGTPPTWTATGWAWGSGSAVLTTGITPTAGYSVMAGVRGFSDTSYDKSLVQTPWASNGRFAMNASLAVIGGPTYIGFGQNWSTPARLTGTGTLALTTTAYLLANPYRNGVNMGNFGAGQYQPTGALDIGPGDTAAGARICVVVVWSVPPTNAEISAWHTAIMARCSV